MLRSYHLFKRKRVRVLFFIVLVFVMASIFIINQVLAHGSMETPISRVYQCFLEGPENPTSAACQAAVATGGTQALYDWNEINIANASGQHQQLIPDGKLCSAGREKYKGFDLARADWPAQTISPDANGNYEFVYRATAPHSTLYFRFYVTKNGYDPTQPLAWSHLEDTPFCTITNVTLQNGRYRMTCPLPTGKSGRHLIYNIWQRSDSPEAFYACSDVIFGQSNITPTPPATATATQPPSGCTAPAWNPTTIYVQGNEVKHNGRQWRAKWWTQGEEPGTTGQWGVWLDLGPCGGSTPPPTATPLPSSTPTATNTPGTVIPTNTPVNTPLPTATPGGGSCPGIPQYVAGTTYTTGQFVKNIGNKYQCTVGGWCSSSAAWAYEPGVGMYWETAWSYVSPCSSSPTPTNTPAPTSTPATPGPSPTPCPNCGGNLPNRLLIGYWHNFNNGSSTLKLREVSQHWDVVNVAFAEPQTHGSAVMAFTPYNATVSEFQNDVQLLHGRNQKVLISVGGANVHLDLQTAAQANDFANSMIAIIETYGFDGLDVDLEGGSLSLGPGDNDFRNPTTPRIVHFITAVQTIVNHFGPGFILTAAPETAYVQGGYSAYSGLYGAYLPLIYAFHDRWTVIHVQHYNSGCMVALNGVCYAQGTANFQVAMAEMLLAGFPVAGTGLTFPALRQEQVAIGLPAAPAAAGGGYTPPATVHQALEYLIKGTPYSGHYPLQNPGGYANFRGLMTWSINWDVANNYQFSTSHRAYLNGLD